MGDLATNAEVLDSLRAVPLFRRVSEEDLENIAALLIERRYPKRSVVVEEGLAGDYMYVIREGRVKVTKASEDGREKIIDFFEAGDHKSFVHLSGGSFAKLMQGARQEQFSDHI